MNPMVQFYTELHQAKPLLWGENHTVAGKVVAQQLNLQLKKPNPRVTRLEYLSASRIRSR